jgi:hypothetical protein
MYKFIDFYLNTYDSPVLKNLAVVTDKIALLDF